MNISELLKYQHELDKEIRKVHEIINKDVWNKRILALYVEISELANEIQSFKYWKKNKIINKEKIIEEYSDGLHFLFSFAIDLKVLEKTFSPFIQEDINIQFIEIYKTLGFFNDDKSKEKLNYLFQLYFGLAILLEISEEEIINGYISKNKENFSRIKNNY